VLKNTLVGKKLAVTGVVDQMTRSQVKKLIEDAGGDFQTEVTSETTILVVGDHPGLVKTTAAHKFSTDIMPN
jgi:NAD-dependent DNA ligase